MSSSEKIKVHLVSKNIHYDKFILSSELFFSKKGEPDYLFLQTRSFFKLPDAEWNVEKESVVGKILYKIHWFTVKL